jgi:hypothetical protein
VVHFEFGQERLTEPHPLNTFELAQGAVDAACVPFSTTCSGSLGSFCKIILFLPHELAWCNRARVYAASTLAATH